MGDLIFGEEDEELQHVVARLLADLGSTLATVEIGTGGLLARRITEVPDYERVYRGGIVAVSLEALVHTVGSSVGANKQTTIVAALESCRERLGGEFAVFVGAFPHFDPDNAAEASPTSEVALVGPNVSRVVDYTFLGDAALNRSRAGKIALNLLRLHFQRS
jgi:nicotinamide-nucleotide amidase